MTPKLARMVAAIHQNVLAEPDFDRCMANGHSLREAARTLSHLSDLAFGKATAMAGQPMVTVKTGAQPS